MTLTDRAKELIKVSGFQVAPAELEAAAARATRRWPTPAVAGVPDETQRRAPEGVDRRARGGRRATSCARRSTGSVAPYKRLAAIEVVDELPRTMTGKLLRRVLVERERTAVAVSP